MARQWFIVDVEKRADKQPTTFSIPPRKERETLQEDALAKLVFTVPALFAKHKGERMWVRVMTVRADGTYHGMVLNDPTIPDGPNEGTTLDFGPEHVLEWLPPSLVLDPKVKGGDLLNEPIEFATPKTTPKTPSGGGGGLALLLIGGALMFAGKRKRRR